jgi:hypothetical protein
MEDDILLVRCDDNCIMQRGDEDKDAILYRADVIQYRWAIQGGTAGWMSGDTKQGGMTKQVVYSGMQNRLRPVRYKQGTEQGFGPKNPCFVKKNLSTTKQGQKNSPVWSLDRFFYTKQGEKSTKQGEKSTKQGSREPRVPGIDVI